MMTVRHSFVVHDTSYFASFHHSYHVLRWQRGGDSIWTKKLSASSHAAMNIVGAQILGTFLAHQIGPSVFSLRASFFTMQPSQRFQIRFGTVFLAFTLAFAHILAVFCSRFILSSTRNPLLSLSADTYRWDGSLVRSLVANVHVLISNVLNANWCSSRSPRCCPVGGILENSPKIEDFGCIRWWPHKGCSDAFYFPESSVSRSETI